MNKVNTLNNVVVGMDGSEASRAALLWAAEHAQGEVYAIHALSPAVELLEAGFQIDTTARVERIRQQLADHWVGDTVPAARVQTRVVEDRVSRALLDAAQAVEADAVVIGANGRERLGGVVGANAARLIHECPRPLVIVPQDEHSRESTDGAIVVAMTGHHDRDRHLLDWARRFGGAGHPLTLVHSLAPGMSGRQSATELEATAAAHLNQLVDDSTTDDDIVISLDDPVTAILDNSTDAPLIVIGSHHSRRIDGYIAGAIAQHLPAASSCAVALIPLPDVEER